MELIKQKKIEIRKALNQLESLEEALQVIIDIVEEVTGCDVKTKRKKREEVDARIIYSVLSSRYTKASTTMIGSMMNRDHSTVLHHRKKAEEFIEVDPQFRSNLNEAEEILLSMGEGSLLEKRIKYHKGKAAKYQQMLKKAS